MTCSSLLDEVFQCIATGNRLMFLSFMIEKLKKHRRISLSVVIIATVLLARFMGRSPFNSFIERDHAETCSKFRDVLHWEFGIEVSRLIDEGHSEAELTDDFVFSSMMNRMFPELQYRAVPVSSGRFMAAYEITGACKDAGTILIEVNDIRWLYKCCSVHGESE